VQTEKRRRYPCARADLRFHSVGGRFLLRDGAGIRDNYLDFPSALVLTYCDGRHDPAAIADAVAGSMDRSDRATLRAGVQRIIEAFANEGIVV
jgi:hypothetical protein